MSETTDTSSWLTKGEAAHVLGVAEKTIERMAKRKQIQQAVRRRPGTASVAVFHPGDIENLKGQQAEAEKPGAFLMPAEKPQRQAETALSIVELLRSAAQRPAEVSLTDKLYLTVKEAVLLSGLPLGYLRSKMKDGSLAALKTGAGWRIKRADLLEL